MIFYWENSKASYFYNQSFIYILELKSNFKELITFYIFHFGLVSVVAQYETDKPFRKMLLSQHCFIVAQVIVYWVLKG